MLGVESLRRASGGDQQCLGLQAVVDDWKGKHVAINPEKMSWGKLPQADDSPVEVWLGLEQRRQEQVAPLILGHRLELVSSSMEVSGPPSPRQVTSVALTWASVSGVGDAQLVAASVCGPS